jgi:N-acetylmuramoyl-L-alanine amidase
MGDMGALSVSGVSEWHYNGDIAARVRRKLEELGHAACVINKYPRPGYTEAIKWLAWELGKRGAECAVELHFNASDSPASHGHEWLHWHASGRGRALAQGLQHEMCQAFPDIRNRGLVSIDSTKSRGGFFLEHTPCPAVIAEPFFGSNRGEWELFKAEREAYAQVLARGILRWKGAL